MQLHCDCKSPEKKNTHSIKAPKTKRIQANIQASIAVSPSALGVLVVTVLKMLTSTRNSVTRSAILPGITSIGMRKEIQETITKRPETKPYFTKLCIDTKNVSKTGNLEKFMVACQKKKYLMLVFAKVLF